MLTIEHCPISSLLLEYLKITVPKLEVLKWTFDRYAELGSHLTIDLINWKHLHKFSIPAVNIASSIVCIHNQNTTSQFKIIMDADPTKENLSQYNEDDTGNFRKVKIIADNLACIDLEIFRLKMNYNGLVVVGISY